MDSEFRLIARGMSAQEHTVKGRATAHWVARVLFATVLSTFFLSTSVQAAGVVGNGSAASCTQQALVAALAGGGHVSFNCGGPTTITVTSTKTIMANTTIDGGGKITISGGQAVGVFAVWYGVTLTVENLTIADGYRSTWGSSGGAIDSDGYVVASNSSFIDNHAEFGGAIYSSQHAVTVTDSLFVSNSAGSSGAGGAIWSQGNVTVASSVFVNNDSGIAGGGSYNGGGGIHSKAGLTVTNSIFSGNSGKPGGAINGHTVTVYGSTFNLNSSSRGGAINARGQLTVTNSTFVGNDASSNGGGIYVDSFFGSVTNCTFSTNSSKFSGGAVYVEKSRDLSVNNNLFAGNTSQYGAGGIGFANGAGMTGGHNLTGEDLGLDPAGLADNGGPAETIALCTANGEPRAGCQGPSPAINAGDQTICAAAPVNNLDQRGAARPGSGSDACSIGAFEADLPVAACTNGQTCRESTGPCDPRETCTNGACPADVRRPAGTPCRSAAGSCDLAETCDGSSPACPADAKTPDGTACNDQKFCNGADFCHAGSCNVHTGNPCPASCEEATDQCVSGCSTGTPCDDGLFCNGADTCASGTCSIHAGNPCSGAQACNESSNQCEGGTPPKTPKRLKESVQCKNGCISLAWRDPLSSETEIQVSRVVGNAWKQSSIESVAVVGPNTTVFQHCGVSTNYLYRVRALGPGGESAWSNVCAVCEPKLDRPANVSVNATSSSVQVNWSHGGDFLRGFVIERKAENATSYTRLSMLAASARSYTDTSPLAGKSLYRLRAVPKLNQCRRASAWVFRDISR